MATTVARLQAVLSADTRDFDRAMDKSDSRMGSLAKTMGKAGLVGAVVGLGAAVKVGFGEFMEAQRVTAQTNAVLKSTGGVANVTTKQVQGLSEALMKKSGVDDEAIQSGQNMLLTFTKIRNETGKGNDVFNQATKATLDLSVAMGKDMQSSAILVGKALNDPIKGMSALGRAGIQFTAEQKDTIKTMVAAGDTMGAQKLILKELETQFGGSAEAAGKTFGGQINIAKERLTNLAGEGVGKALPKLAELGNWFTMEAVPKIRQLVTYLNETFMPVIRGLVNVFRDAFAAIGRLLEEHKTEVATIVAGVKAVLKGIATVFEEVIFPALRFYFKDGGPFDVIFGTAIKIVSGVVTAIGKIVGAVRDAVNGVKAFWSGDGGKVFRSVFGAMEDALRPVVSAFQAVVDSVKWLIENISKIPSFSTNPDPRTSKFPLPGGDAHDPGYAGLNLMGASPVMAPFAYAASQYGLQVTSGLRPGAITANGTPSDHGVGKALDVAGSASSMAAYFMSLVGNAAVKQAFYDPRGSIFGGAWSSYREGGHSDHVHVATYDQGGILRPGLTMAWNGTGRNEYVGGGNVTIPVSIGGENVFTIVWDQLRQRAAVHERRNGRSAF